MTAIKRHLHKILFIIASIEVLIALIIMFSLPSVQADFALATSVKPETFTELYFEDHTKLPHIITPFSQYSFAFTIHNLENRDMTYPYEVYVDLGEEKIILEKSTVTIKKNESKTIKEQFTSPQVLPRNKIVVRLTEKNQSISFWIEGEK